MHGPIKATRVPMLRQGQFVCCSSAGVSYDLGPSRKRAYLDQGTGFCASSFQHRFHSTQVLATGCHPEPDFRTGFGGMATRDLRVCMAALGFGRHRGARSGGVPFLTYSFRYRLAWACRWLPVYVQQRLGMTLWRVAFTT